MGSGSLSCQLRDLWLAGRPGHPLRLSSSLPLCAFSLKEKASLWPSSERQVRDMLFSDDRITTLNSAARAVM